jgi:hypothetical protein
LGVARQQAARLIFNGVRRTGFPACPLMINFARTAANIAESLASSTAFFTATYWNIGDGFFASAMTYKA